MNNESINMFEIKKASLNDAKKIQKLINNYAEQDLMLPLSLNAIYENIRNFSICINKENNEIIGCGSLNIAWENLGEIRSLAIDANYKNQGAGKLLVQNLIEEAIKLDLKKIFVLTYKNDFFKKLGFDYIDKANLPHKIWKDCINCPKFPNCDEIAMEININAKSN